MESDGKQVIPGQQTGPKDEDETVNPNNDYGEGGVTASVKSQSGPNKIILFGVVLIGIIVAIIVVVTVASGGEEIMPEESDTDDPECVQKY